MKEIYLLVSKDLNCEPELKEQGKYVHAICPTMEEAEKWLHHYNMVFCDLTLEIIKVREEKYMKLFD